MDSMKELNEEGEGEECTGPKPTYEAQQSKYFLTNENRFERVRETSRLSDDTRKLNNLCIRRKNNPAKRSTHIGIFPNTISNYSILATMICKVRIRVCVRFR